jgi:murein DD-endopeptidase MepM/ murein hydrolase activator NlpD
VRRLACEFETGIGRGSIILILVVLVLGVVLGVKVLSSAAPSIQLQGQVKGIGENTPLVIKVTDTDHRLRRIQVTLQQGERTFVVTESNLDTPPWWKFWSRAGRKEAELRTHVGRKQIPELQEGRATLRITATNDSWGRFFRGGMSEVHLDLPVDFTPPEVQVLSFPHYVNLGGSELVVFKVSEGTAEAGVQVGDYFFPSWPLKESLPETRLCLFAFPYNIDPKTPARILARDEVGNEALANFTYRVFPKTFTKDTINITDDFIARVVPPIIRQSPEIADQGSPLRNFLLVNGRLRQINAQQLVELAKKTSPTFLWTEPFVQLGNSKVEAAFADRRTYLYNGQVIDHQDHLGFDLAVTEHIPVVAANDGTVIHAGNLGIYGNAILLDHGCGLQSLYGHLSSIDVKVGESVKRGQVMGRSGQTGLAAGDHLHFTMLLDGIPVNPVEWWDAHWIHDRIEAKLAPYR